MTRKITAIITATLLLLALLPVGVALAATNATAQLVSVADSDAVNLFPGSRTLGLRVNNNPPPGGLLPIGGPTADPIRFVNVVLPADASFRVADAGSYTAPPDWTVEVSTSPNGLQSVQFRADEDSSGIGSGNQLDFEVPTEVLAPLNGDRDGRVRVYVDSNRMGDTQNEATPTGNGLVSRVRVLEVLAGTLGATAPTGAMDGSGTTGQAITYAFDVKNHSRSPLNVVPNLSSNHNSDSITQGPAEEIDPGDEGTLTAEVTLGNPRNAEFTALASATDANPSSTQSLPTTANYLIDALVELVLHTDQFQPTHVSNFENPEQYFFELPVTKNGRQGWTAESERDGEAVTTLTFCDNEVPLAEGVTFDEGNGQEDTLVFGPIVGNDIVAPSSGDIHECDGDFVLDGPDGNGFGTVITRTVNNLITIDIRIPFIEIDLTLPNDEDGLQQVRAKNGDDIEVTGSIDVGCATLQRVALEHEAGGTIVETERTAGGWTNGEPCSGSGNNISITFADVDFGPDQVLELGDFLAVGEGVSAAGRPAAGFSEVFQFDNWEPVFNFAQTTLIESGSYAGQHGVIVGFQENGALIGGCDVRQWDVSGQGSTVFGSVTDVLYMNGDRCVRGEPGPDGGTARILVIDGLDSIDETPDVEYTPGESELPITLGALPGELTGTIGGVADELPLPVPFHQLPLFDPDRAKDGAGHFAADNIVRAIVGILPPLPEILQATRANSQGGEPEEARQVDGVRWTRFSADNDIEVRVDRAQPGYLIRVVDAVLDGDDCIPDASTVHDEVTAGDGENWIAVPTGSEEDVYTRALQLRNAFDWGPALCFQVGLDQTAPVFDSVQRLSPSEVRVDATERLWGANVNSAWYALEHGEWDQEDDAPGYVFYGATGVSGDQAEPQRTLTVALEGGQSDFAGAEYTPGTGDDRRLEDKAGNKLVPARILAP